MSFVHLQVETAYSLLSSTVSIPALVKKAEQCGYEALAITDRNVLYGSLQFYEACRKAHIKPLIGLTADVEVTEGEIYPVVLLAKNNSGYARLLKISSVIQTQPNRAISWKWLHSYSEGLFALSPGKEGEIEQYIAEGRVDLAKAAAKRYIDTFGNESFYLTLQHNGGEDAESILAEKYNFAKESGVRTAVTNHVRYLESADAFAYNCIRAIGEGRKLEAEEAAHEQGESYLKNVEEMNRLFASYPESLANTAQIAEECNVMIETNSHLLPKYPIERDTTAREMLYRLCEEGSKKRGLSGVEYEQRLAYELDVIHQMGFNDYFLIVWDFMKYAKDQGILTGPGRGSAAGSLVAYVLGITDVDPLRHGLLFERFLNPHRVSMPDIDIDFPDIRRDEVIRYVADKYGKNHVAHIITFGTFAAKAAVRDTARAFGLSTKEMDALSRMVPARLGITIKSALEEESSPLREYMEQDERNRLMIETAAKLEGLPRHTSTHAAGVIISEAPLIENIPVKEGPDGIFLTQLPMEDVEKIGLLKMDFLGLRNLTLLEEIVKSIRMHTGRTIQLEEIPFSDQKTFMLLQKGDTTGIFQLESDGMRRVLRDLRPTEFEDIVAVNALFRPGPMENIPHYIARKHQKEKVSFPHPDLKPILDVTYGVIVYQEQIMQIASTMAGFTLGEADLLRRAVSKKKKDVLDEQRKRFVDGARENGYEAAVANTTYDLIVRFANYGFNRSHAVAYSMIAWKLAWLKAHFPKYFMAGLLTSVIGNQDKIADYIAEAKQKEIEILPPSINKSSFPFIPEKEGIRFSLSGIKGVGVSVLKEITYHRKKGPFRDIFDFCLRVSLKVVNRKVLESLTYAGCFDEFDLDRAVILATLDVAIEHAELMKPADGSEDLFTGDEAFRIEPRYVEVEPILLSDKLAFEMELTGVFLSDHPASAFSRLFLDLGAQDLIQLSDRGPRKKSAGVYITGMKTIRTKKGEVMAFISMSDATGQMDGVAFPKEFARLAAVLQKGNVVFISGSVERRNGAWQFIIQDAIPGDKLQEEDGNRQNLYLKLPETFHDSETLKAIQTILRKYQGNTSVILFYEKSRKTIKLGDRYRVNLSEKCLNNLKELLGSSNVKVK